MFEIDISITPSNFEATPANNAARMETPGKPRQPQQTWNISVTQWEE